jgi:hypothetical protein
MHPARTNKPGPRWQATWLAAVALMAAAPVRAAEPVTRTSDAPVDFDMAWLEPGFRMQLRFGYESLRGHPPAPPLPAFAVAIEPSYRLSEQLSLGLGLRYSVLLGDWTGLRWNTSGDFSWHPTPGAYVAVGGGYGGMLGERVQYEVDYDEDGSYTTGDGPEGSRLLSCAGHGVVALARAGFLFAVGDLFSTGPVLQADVQRTRCKGTSLGGHLRTEVWWQPSWQMSWAFTWR